MNFLLAGIGKLLGSSAGVNLATRLVNKYTAHGIMIVVMQLASMGVLPQGMTDAIDGLDTKDIAMYCSIAIGIYFIFHAPKFKTKLEKLNYRVAVVKAQTELHNAEKELQECLDCKKEINNEAK